MTKVIYFVIAVLISAVTYHVNAKEKGTCIPPDFSIIDKIGGILTNLPKCKFEKYDVSRISMSVLSPENPTVIEQITTTEEFDARGCCGKPTLFTHHGFLESKDTAWNPELQLQHALATKGCAVAFDFNEAASESSICSTATTTNVDNIAEECSKRVYELFVETGCLAPKDITYMGFSMGSPIAIRNAHNMIKTYNTSVGTVYCTDPAGSSYDTNFAPPEFWYYNEVAKHVPRLQCIHTSIILGTGNYNLCPSAIITGDCLRSQPVCSNSWLVPICSHTTGPSYLIASYKYPGSIVAKKCSTCPWVFGLCETPQDTEVAGYQTEFKKGKFWFYSPETCIDVYYS